MFEASCCPWPCGALSSCRGFCLGDYGVVAARVFFFLFVSCRPGAISLFPCSVSLRAIPSLDAMFHTHALRHTVNPRK